MSHHRPRGLAAAVLLGLLVSLGGLREQLVVVLTSESSPSTAAASGSSTPGTASAEVCAARDDLQTSITDFKDVSIVANGTTGLQAAITKVKDNLTALKSAAGDEIKPQVTDLQDALTGLQTAVSDVSSRGVAPVAAAAGKVAITGGELISALQGLKCSLTRDRGTTQPGRRAPRTSLDVGAACAAGRMCRRGGSP